MSPEIVADLCQATDLALSAIRQTAAAISHLMLQRKIDGLIFQGKRRKKSLLDTPTLPSGFFETAVETVMERFIEARGSRGPLGGIFLAGSNLLLPPNPLTLTRDKFLGQKIRLSAHIPHLRSICFPKDGFLLVGLFSSGKLKTGVRDPDKA